MTLLYFFGQFLQPVMVILYFGGVLAPFGYIEFTFSQTQMIVQLVTNWYDRSIPGVNGLIAMAVVAVGL